MKLACDVVEKIEAICDKHGNKPGELINILHEAQSLHGYLPEEMQRIIARKLNIPASKVYGVVTFYSFFTMTPKGISSASLIDSGLIPKVISCGLPSIIFSIL